MPTGRARCCTATEQMRSHLLLHPLPATAAAATLFHASSSPSPSHYNSTDLLRFLRRPSARPPPLPPGALPRWDSNAEPIPGGRSAFGLGSEVDDDYDDDDDGAGAGAGARKQRVWWSGYDDEGDGLEFEGDEEFWGFKVLRAFGWMFPAIAISLLLGTGPNAFIMALAVPLGQTLLSLAFERVWGETSERDSWKPRPQAKTKKKPFVNPRSEGRKSGGKQENGSANGRNAYQSWATTNASYSKAGSGGRPRFGGWDELDQKAGTREVPKPERSRKTYVPSKQSKKGKFSRIGRVRETPLLVRLLIAAFPFLGFWTKLLF
ncbi:hypothetical protein BT93_F0507 [Corymbia citriodora subsp. variegata]|nr:hypothetical protein BT93_F0507 [Corymbia citriodora subsp. variegata]KAF8023036.1 hypothetical protein BT93_F0507 [Corymbia citriodora subsp. variegata]